MKIGALMVVHCDVENVAYAIRGIYDFVDAIVVVHSDTSWAKVKKSDGTLGLLHSLEDPKNKLRIYTGSYPIQKQHRTFAMEKIKEEGCTHMFVVDGDEIWDPTSLTGVRQTMEDNPDNWLFRMRFCQMWKNLGYRLEPDRYMEVLWRLADDLYFVGNARRLVYKDNRHTKIRIDIPGPICYHLTAVCSDKFMKEKMTTRGYKDKVVKGWFENIWLKWHPEMENLHPTRPRVYRQAVPLDKTKLPEFMKTHRFYDG